MARTDTYLDAMLRHLGAAYYESVHGRATRTDVTRALDTVEEHLKDPAAAPAAGSAARSHPARPTPLTPLTRPVRSTAAGPAGSGT